MTAWSSTRTGECAKHYTWQEVVPGKDGSLFNTAHGPLRANCCIRGLPAGPLHQRDAVAPEVARLPRALEPHGPITTETLERSFEFIWGKSARDGLEAYRGTKSTVLADRSIDVGSIALESRLTCHDLTFDGQRDDG
jgi:hypothetical protein